jgi:hypothetical protein
LHRSPVHCQLQCFEEFRATSFDGEHTDSLALQDREGTPGRIASEPVVRNGILLVGSCHERRGRDSQENEELRQATEEPFSLPYQDLCKEQMDLKFRIMDLKEALSEITGSTEAALRQVRRNTSAASTS